MPAATLATIRTARGYRGVVREGPELEPTDIRHQTRRPTGVQGQAATDQQQTTVGSAKKILHPQSGCFDCSISSQSLPDALPEHRTVHPEPFATSCAGNQRPSLPRPLHGYAPRPTLPGTNETQRSCWQSPETQLVGRRGTLEHLGGREEVFRLGESNRKGDAMFRTRRLE